MQIWAEGRGTGWNKIYFTIEYETTRNGEYIGIRYKIKWAINSKAFFGYNIVADVWTEGINYGRTIKENRPNRGSGESWFPENGDYYWFKKGYTNNDINSCRIIIYSTNGGTIRLDTADYTGTGETDITFKAPTGYTVSDIASEINFNVGNSLNVRLNNPTNVVYNHNIKLQIMNDSNNWIDIKAIQTTERNFELTYSKDLILQNVKTRNDIRTRLIVDTYYGQAHIGYTIKEGYCYIRDSKPDSISFIVTDWNNQEITSITSGFGPYRDDSNIFVKISGIEKIPVKDYAELKKIIIIAGGMQSEISPQNLIDTTSEYYIETFIDPFSATNNFVELQFIDSRGNKTAVRKTIAVEELMFPEIIKCEVKRQNGIDNKTKLIVEGNLGSYSIYSNLGIRYLREQANGEEIETISYDIEESQMQVNQQTGKFSYSGYIYGDLGADGFTKGKEFTLGVRVYTNITYTNNQVGLVNVIVRNGKPVMYFSKSNNAVAFGQEYNAEEGGPLQVNGKDITKVKITTGEEYETNIIIDGKKVYFRAVDLGALPNNTSKNITDQGMESNILVHYIGGVAHNSTNIRAFSIPGFGPGLIAVGLCRISFRTILIETNGDLSSYSATAYIYYSYKEEA